MTTDPLIPIVKGRLADTEAAIIAQIQAGQDASFRTTISLELTVALAAVRAAHAEKRDSFSNLCAVALQEYSARHGAPLPALAEFVAKLQAAATTDQEAKRLVIALEATLRKSQRRTPARAAA